MFGFNKSYEIFDGTPKPKISQPVIEILRLMEEKPFSFYDFKIIYDIPIFRKSCSYSDGKIQFSLEIEIIIDYFNPNKINFCTIKVPLNYYNNLKITDFYEKDFLSSSFDELKKIHDEYNEQQKRKRICDYFGINPKET